MDSELLFRILEIVIFMAPIIGIIWKISKIVHKVDTHDDLIKQNSDKIKILDDKSISNDEKIINILIEIRERLTKVETKLEIIDIPRKKVTQGEI